jgi:hypothetical protein
VLNGYSAYLSPAALEMVRSNPAVEYVESDGVIHIADVEAGSGGIYAQYIPARCHLGAGPRGPA